MVWFSCVTMKHCCQTLSIYGTKFHLYVHTHVVPKHVIPMIFYPVNNKPVKSHYF